ncbi:MAG: methyl-accepting chemotaxis protein [Zetaproteobacteria bacterium CG12_big_fil_rev_8_21_14_0_65_54_13]|nr:MAG: methyl-accepting chemotaxis protein [Zetaproteobacteria bacterium CG12_big_fil_rev_8_21_14_0_65_54_13]PIX54275.1 MAG: methyl-accepting chemotaxis protein [Zetaproteobacteria bacterium CG_4_10_14_3_um_filter_54_28]PJA30420.1 MAG: methyl-accepting chemotaxis protein [Zetaproteobacteria bacterium CG_4_9_14_3_um_filter_54_145]
MNKRADAGASRQTSLRALARRNFILSLLLFLVLIGIVFASSWRDGQAMQHLENEYKDQFHIEQFKASLSNIMVPLNDFTLTADEKNFIMLRASVREYQLSYNSVKSIPDLNEQDQQALEQVAGLMSEVMTIANDVADKKIPARQAAQITLLAQNLVLAAQKKLTVIVNGLEERLSQRSLQHKQDAELQMYVLLGFIILIVLMLEFLNRRLLARAVVVSRASSSVAESVGDILEVSEMQSGASEQQSRFMERVTKGLQLIADAGKKIDANIKTLEKNAQVAANFAKGGAAEAAQTAAGLNDVRVAMATIPQRVVDLESRLEQLASGLDRIQDITDESQLMVLNASIDGSDSVPSSFTGEVQRMAGQTREYLDGIRADLRLAVDAAGSVAGCSEDVKRIEGYLESCGQSADVLKRLEQMSQKNAQGASILLQASERQSDRNGKILQALQHISELLHISGDKMRAHKEASARLSEASESLQNMS